MDPLAPVRWFDRLQQRHALLAVPVATIKKQSDDEAGTLAVSVAFYAFFAVFPLLLVFVTVLGYVLAGDHALMASVQRSVLSRFPVIGDNIRSNRLRGSAVALIAGVALSLWSGLSVTGAMTAALDRVWEIPRQERSSFLRTKLRGLLLILTLGTMFVVASGASGAVSGGLVGSVLEVFGIVVSLVMNLALFLASFHFLCSQPPALRKLLPGAVLAAVLWTVLQVLGGLYIGHFKNTSSAYGTFAVVLGVLAWLHLGAQMTMLCAELNTVLDGRRWPRPLLGDG